MTDKHKGDLDRASTQNAFADLARDAAQHPHEGGFLKGVLNSAIRGAAQGTPYSEAMVSRTEFDGYELNAMVDLVDQTDPEDLESSGRALWDARDAIKAAADELKGHFDSVPWVGKAGDDFRAWGAGLVTSTYDLSAFAGGAGDQITAAAVGLASVRKAMPPRDSRTVATHPRDIPTPARIASNSEYAAAVQVEKHRQEAINQMNRLASYYAVSREQLQGLNDNAPTFKSVPDVGMPKPNSAKWDPSGDAGSNPAQGAGTNPVASHHAAVASTAANVRPHAGDVSTPTADVGRHIAVPDHPVGTNIDSVGTLPPSTTTPVTGHTPPMTSTPVVGGDQAGPFDGGPGLPIPNRTSGRSWSGAGGPRTPVSAQGRTAAVPGSRSGPGYRATGQGIVDQTERAASTGQSAARGTTPGSKPSSMGRGVTGGTPRPSGTAAPRVNGGPATGAGRSNGVVGGRPSVAGDAAAKGGARIPRGTVIGGEGAANSQPTGRPRQRGVFGSSESMARSGSTATGSRAGSGTSEPVTGRPIARNSLAGAERNGMTRGGSGLVRGAGQNGKPGGEGEAQGSQRPDYLVEDEETHLPDKPRRDVPPVVN